MPIPVMGIAGAITSGIGSGVNAFGESQGASASIGAINRQLAEQKALQEQSDREMMQRLQQQQIASPGGLSNYRASKMMAGGDTQNLFDANAAADRLNNLADVSENTALANRNREQLARQANRLQELYGQEVDVAGMKGIGLRTIGQGMRKVGRTLMKAQMMKGFGGAAGSVTSGTEGLGGSYQTPPTGSVNPYASSAMA